MSNNLIFEKSKKLKLNAGFIPNNILSDDFDGGKRGEKRYKKYTKESDEYYIDGQPRGWDPKTRALYNSGIVHGPISGMERSLVPLTQRTHLMGPSIYTPRQVDYIPTIPREDFKPGHLIHYDPFTGKKMFETDMNPVRNIIKGFSSKPVSTPESLMLSPLSPQQIFRQPQTTRTLSHESTRALTQERRNPIVLETNNELDDVSDERKNINGSGVLILQPITVSGRQEVSVILVKSLVGGYEDPGGSLDPGKKSLQNAIKETFEETGVIDLTDAKISHYIDVENDDFAYRSYILCIKEGNYNLQNLFNNNMRILRNANLGNVFNETTELKRFLLEDLFNCINSGNRVCKDFSGANFTLNNRIIEILKNIYDNRSALSVILSDCLNVNLVRTVDGLTIMKVGGDAGTSQPYSQPIYYVPRPQRSYF